MATGSVSQPATGDHIDGILGGVKWNSNNVLFNFPTSASYYPSSDYSSNNEPSGFVAGGVSASFKSMVRAALDQFEAVSNLTFTEVGATALSNISVARSSSVGDIGFGGFGYYPGSLPRSGDVWFDDQTANVGDTQVLSRGTWRLVMHELGHAVGLKHGHEANTYGALPTAFDFNDYTLMSYRRFQGGPASNTAETNGNPQSLMMLDIAALQTMYGTNFSTNSGNTTYGWDPNTGQMSINGVGQLTPQVNRVFQTIWDGNGIDTYNLSNYTTNLIIDLNPGGKSIFSDAQLAIVNDEITPNRKATGNVFNALQFNNDPRSLIENANGGTGNDTITGNAAINTLNGNNGNDTLSGLANNDKLNGGAGNDVLNGGLGADIMTGGAGNDSYTVDNVGDRTIEAANGGTDAVNSSVTVTLAVNVENLTLTGAAVINALGNALSNVMTGNTAANSLNGSTGNDTINGGAGNDALNGGAGIDSMTGGAGNDFFTVDNVADKTFEGLNGGIDRVTSAVTFTLAANVENLTLVGTAAINGTGNTLANVITGNAAANVLNGLAGNDVLIGAAGKDTMTGSTGADRFDFNTVAEIGLAAARDLIVDFATNLDDKIDLSTIDANGAAAGHAFLFLAANGAGFTGVAGQLCWVTQGTGASAVTIVEGDINGNGAADFQIQLNGLKTLTAGDFVL